MDLHSWCQERGRGAVIRRDGPERPWHGFETNLWSRMAAVTLACRAASIGKNNQHGGGGTQWIVTRNKTAGWVDRKGNSLAYL